MPNFYPLHKNNIGITVVVVAIDVITETCVLCLAVEAGRACKHLRYLCWFDVVHSSILELHRTQLITSVQWNHREWIACHRP